MTKSSDKKEKYIRNNCVQAIKGLCIIFVVLIHLPWGWEDPQWLSLLWLSARKVINFAVATFFFLSAYYTPEYNRLSDRNNIFQFYKKRIKRLILPYITWSIVYVFLLPIITTGNPSDRWAFYLLTGYGPLYFLLALTQFTIIAPLIQKYKNNPIANFFFWLVTPAYLVFYYTFNFHNGYEFKPEQFLCFPWFAVYYLGLKLQQHDNRQNIAQLTSLFGCMFIALLYSMIEGIMIDHYSGIYSFAISQITTGSILYSIVVCLIFHKVFINRPEGSKPTILSRIGDYSMGIFLMHIFINWIFRYLVMHYPINMLISWDNPVQCMFVNIVIWIASVAISFLTCKFLSERMPSLNLYLGLK